MADNTLEHEFERRVDADADAKDLWHRYQGVKSYLAANYYDWIQAAAPYLTNHGRLHIESVIRAASGLVLRPQGGRKSTLTPMDIFLLLSAILWHDVGNAYGRREHAQRVAELTENVKTLGFPNPETQRLVSEIASAHSGVDGLRGARDEEDCSTENGTYTVRPRALAAVLRFADEISEDRSRISQALLPSVPAENRIYWEYANAITATRADPARERVVLTITLQHDSAVNEFHCSDYASVFGVGGSMTLIEYLLHRLEKLNNERAYCAPHFRQFSSINQVLCRFTIVRGADRAPDYDGLEIILGDSGLARASYPKISVVNEFFAAHPKWSPIEIKKAFGL